MVNPGKSREIRGLGKANNLKPTFTNYGYYKDVKILHFPGYTHSFILSSDNMKQRFLGLRGSKLHLAIWIEACFGIMTFGYNQGAAGAVLTNVAFNSHK